MNATAASGTAFTAGGAPPRNHAALDLLRFGAALFIVLFHYGANAPTPLREIAPVFGDGWIATDFFLMLSGYVLGRAYGRALDHGRLGAWAFVRRRALRVWPAHLVVLVGFAAALGLAGWVGGGQPPGKLQPRRVPAAGRHAARPDRRRAGRVEHAHLDPIRPARLLPAVPAAVARLAAAARPPGGALGGAGVLAAAAALSLVVFGRPLVDIGWGLVRALPLFTAGALLARFAPSLRLRRAGWVVAVAVLAIPAAQAQPRSLLADLEVIGGEAVLILAADAWALGGFALAAYLGEIAFALFLVHEPVSALWFHAVAAEVEQLGLTRSTQWLLWGLSPAVAVAAAAAFHAAVDAPLLRLLRGKGLPAPCPAVLPGAL